MRTTRRSTGVCAVFVLTTSPRRWHRRREGQASEASPRSGIAMLDSVLREWKNDVLETAADRYERRLTEVEGGLRLEITRMHASLIRWMFVCGQIAHRSKLLLVIIPPFPF
jgi:hypothetical protein